MSRVRRWLAQHGVRWFTICDDERGRLWAYGRLIVHFYAGSDERAHERERFTLNAAWHLRPEKTFGAEVLVGGGDSNADLTVHLGLFGMDGWLTYESLPRQWCERILPGSDFTRHGFPYTGQTIRITEAVTTGLRFHDGAFWWSLWAEANTYRSADPWWRRAVIHPADVLLGREQHRRETLRVEPEVDICLPEGTYRGSVTLSRGTWKRPRWPFAKVLYLGNIDVDRPPLVPGKGENAWDSGDDMIFSMSRPARSVADMVGAYVGAVLHDRERHGGSVRWQPGVERGDA